MNSLDNSKHTQVCATTRTIDCKIQKKNTKKTSAVGENVIQEEFLGKAKEK